jgi:hypothetical protein
MKLFYATRRVEGRERIRNNGGGHYARFENLFFDLRRPRDFEKAAKVFGEDRLLEHLPKITRGQNKGATRGTMIVKICYYGGMTENGIARPHQVSEITLTDEHIYDAEGKADRTVFRYIGRDRILYRLESGKIAEMIGENLIE